jgi:hypothetical protein
MPFINLNGQLTEVTQEQFDLYTVGQNVNPGTPTSPQIKPSEIAAGGDVTVTPTATSKVLTPNTTNNSPDQTLTTNDQAISQNTATNFGVTTQYFEDGTSIQTFEDGSQIITDLNGSLTGNPAPAEDPQALARAGLTTDQLTLLGAADATDPFIRSNLGLPPLSEIQTLSGAIGNVNFGNIGEAIGNTFGNLSSSFGNAIGNIGDFFSRTGSDPVPESSIDRAPAEVVPGPDTGSVAYGEDGELLPGYQLNETNDPVYVGGNADTPVQTEADTTVPVTAEEGYYQQFVEAFQQEQDNPTPAESPYAPVAAVGDTPLVETAGTVTVESAGAEFDTATPIAIDPENYTAEELNTIADAQGVGGEEGFITTDTFDGQLSADELNAIADAQGVGGEEGFITSDTFDGQLTPDELDAIADAQGVGGEEGFITSDTFAGQESLTADELNAIADAQGVAGEEGFITSDTLARDPGSYSAEELDAIAAAQGVDDGNATEGGITDQQLFDNEAATSAQSAKERAQKQQTITQQSGQQTTKDWRVKLTLAKNADYLYNSNNPGILKPLANKGGTGGVVFPYTPTINTNYRADYSTYNLTHSNYRGYFYNNSYVDAINLTATFTAQDTQEAEYLLAVIHFFRSVTKMFYGQDTQRGSPPPLVYLSGLGEFQFNRHPCVVSQFTYTLPADVDYIRATSIVNQGINFSTVRNKQSAPISGLAGVSRLANALLPKGAKASPPAQQSLSVGNPTYVPTKMEIVLTLLPVQSRNQVSKIFKLSEFASGNQLKGGFW